MSKRKWLFLVPATLLACAIAGALMLSTNSGSPTEHPQGATPLRFAQLCRPLASDLGVLPPGVMLDDVTSALPGERVQADWVEADFTIRVDPEALAKAACDLERGERPRESACRLRLATTFDARDGRPLRLYAGYPLVMPFEYQRQGYVQTPVDTRGWIERDRMDCSPLKRARPGEQMVLCEPISGVALLGGDRDIGEVTAGQKVTVVGSAGRRGEDLFVVIRVERAEMTVNGRPQSERTLLKTALRAC